MEKRSLAWIQAEIQSEPVGLLESLNRYIRRILNNCLLPEVEPEVFQYLGGRIMSCRALSAWRCCTRHDKFLSG